MYITKVANGSHLTGLLKNAPGYTVSGSGPSPSGLKTNCTTANRVATKKHDNIIKKSFIFEINIDELVKSPI